MLKQLCLQNFKAIAPSTHIGLGELSILCGSNSSGKSSLIQAILMLSQAFSSRYDFNTMVLNGHLVRLGAFRDIVSHSASQKDISISFRLAPRPHLLAGPIPSLIEYSCTFGNTTVTSSDDEYHPSVKQSRLTMTYQVDGGERIETFAISGQPVLPRNITGPSMRMSVDEANLYELEQLNKDFPDLRIVGCESTSFIPTTVIGVYNRSKRLAAQTIGLMTGKAPGKVAPRDVVPDVQIPRAFFQALNACIRDQRTEMESTLSNVDELQKLIGGVTSDIAKRILAKVVEANLPINDKTIPKKYISDQVTAGKDWFSFLAGLGDATQKALASLIDKCRGDLIAAWDAAAPQDFEEVRLSPRSLIYVSQYLAQYFARSVKYLGPLRNEPKAVYASEGHSDPNNVGLKGEYTAAALHMNRDRLIKYPSPVLSDDGALRIKEEYGSVERACKEWLSYLGVIIDYDTTDKGKLGYEIFVKIDSHDEWQDLTHVGVGVSQVLPIVLMALLSEPGELLIFEQPELHLHPKVQSRLCDFFCALASVGRQSIIETHSEYLINRLRLRIVQESPPGLAEQSSVFFVTKAEGVSRFDRVNINEFGAILEWPQDFFDQTDQEVEKILIEAGKKRRRIKEESNAGRRTHM